jgi:hypothetical protein
MKTGGDPILIMKKLCLLLTMVLARVTFGESPTPTATPEVSPTHAAQPTPATDPVYGEYPANYKNIVMDWLYSHLQDPLSAKVEWQGEPKRTELPAARGRKLYGYLVTFTVNARNQFGAPTGKQSHGILIHNGEVIKATGFGYNQQR